MKQTSNLITLGMALLDLVFITLAFLVAYRWRFDGFQDIGKFVWLYYFSAPLLLFLLLRYGVLAGFRHQTLQQIFVATLKAFIVVGVISSTVLYLSKTADFSRLLFGYYFSLAAFFVLLEKAAVKKLFERYLRRGGMNVRVAVVGYGARFDRILAELRERPQLGIHPALVVDLRAENRHELIAQMRASVIDEVYVSCPRGEGEQAAIDNLLLQLEHLGLPIRIAINYDELQEYYGQYHCKLGGGAGVLLAPYNLDPDQRIIKRLMDLLGATVGLVVLFFLFPIVAIAIKLDSPGPIFFPQLRVGKGGRRFRMFKFRTMCLDAEERREELAKYNMHSGPMFKMENDPRITRVGSVMRKYSIDEFPQFWNVFKGDMSLVGARPPTVAEVEKYEDHHFRRISIRPGLTGLWQVSGRNGLQEFESVVALDVQYIKHWSLWLDLRIVLRTVRVVLFPGQGRGI